MTRNLVSFAIFITASLVARVSSAAVLTEYQFTNNRASSNVPVGAVATTFDNGAGFTFLTGYQMTTPSSTVDPSLYITANQTNGTEATAVSGNDYYTFTLTPVAGISLDLTSLAFRYALDQTGSSGTFTGTFFVRSSLDNFAATLGSVSLTAGNGTSVTAFSNASISLAAPQFQNLTSGVTFHIYIYDDQSTATRKDLLDDVILNGSLAVVPEPSTYAMMGLGIGLLAAVQRFRPSHRSA